VLVNQINFPKACVLSNGKRKLYWIDIVMLGYNNLISAT